MKKGVLIFILLFIISLNSSLSYYQAYVNPEVEDAFVDNNEAEVIVFLKDIDINVINNEKDIFNIKKQIVKKTQDTVLNDINFLDIKSSNFTLSSQIDFKLEDKFSVTNGFSGNITKTGLKKLKSNPYVLKIEPIKRYNIILDSSLPLINATVVNTLQINSFNVTGNRESICILDTGINYTHESFGSCSFNDVTTGNCAKVINGTDFVTEDTDPVDDNGHGTHIAGIAAANGTVKGVAPDAGIVAVKVCDSAGSCTNADIIQGIDFCNENKNNYNISVISMSLGDNGQYNNASSCPTTFSSSLADSYRSGIFIVAASGNNNYLAGISYPACDENVTSVGAVYDSNVGSKTWSACTDSSTEADQIVCFTNRGFLLDLLAPGAVINSTSFNGATEEISGTSMAAPHVAGAVALLIQYKKDENNTALNQTSILDAFNSTGKLIDDSLNSNLNFSRIDILAALISLDARSPDIFGEDKTPSIVTNETDAIFFVNVTDTTLDSVWIEGNWSGNIENFTVTDKVDQQYNFTVSSGNFSIDEVISWQFYSNDSNGNINSTAILTFTVTSNVPNITINEPSNDSFLINEEVTFNYSVSDDLDSNLTCQLYFDDILNQTDTALTSTTNIFLINAIEATHNWNITCNDTSNNLANTDLMIFTIDLTNPIVNLDFPENNTFANETVIFNFTLIDNNPSNCSLYSDFNGNFELNQTLTDIINSSTTSFNEVNLIDNNYIWNVQCFDKANRNSWNDSNFTIKVDANAPLFYIDEPRNTTYPTDIDIELNFTIIETNLDTKWYNLDDSENISLSENVTFNTTEGSHTLKLYANDTLLRENITSVSFSVDLTNPVIVLISPQNSSTTTSSSTTLSYNVSDAGIASCSLIIDNSIDQTDSSIEVNIEQSFTKSFSSSNNGLHTWNVNCTDNANRENSSEIFDITVSISSSSGGSGGGGSGGGGAGGASDSTETQATETQLEAKKEAEEHVISFSASEENLVEVIEDDRISFKIKDNSHLAIINDITKDSVTITISSEPITITLKIKEIKTIDLDNDNINELSIKLEDIIDGTAVLIFKEIKIVETKKKGEKSENITEITAAAVSEKNGRVNYFIIFAIIIILIITPLFIMKRRRLKIKYLISRHKIRRLKEKDL